MSSDRVGVNRRMLEQLRDFIAAKREETLAQHCDIDLVTGDPIRHTLPPRLEPQVTEFERWHAELDQVVQPPAARTASVPLHRDRRAAAALEIAVILAVFVPAIIIAVHRLADHFKHLPLDHFRRAIS